MREATVVGRRSKGERQIYGGEQTARPGLARDCLLQETETGEGTRRDQEAIGIVEVVVYVNRGEHEVARCTDESAQLNTVRCKTRLSDSDLLCQLNSSLLAIQYHRLQRRLINEKQLRLESANVRT